jgi:uncharacterized protein YbdZ (MbtH family)
VEHYIVVMNHEEQYSIWPTDREIPLGWTSVGKSGSKEDCLKYVEEVWTDMRPLSLRKAMEQSRDADAATIEEGEPDQYESTVARLTKGSHPVRAVLGKDNSLDAFRKAVAAGYVHIEFTNTRGGTTLGVRLDRSACDLRNLDADTPAGSVRLAGRLTLDFVKVRCTADIDVATLAGPGRLEVESAPQ